MHVCVHIHIETREGTMRREKKILREEEKKTLEYRRPENRRGSCLGEVRRTECPGPQEMDQSKVQLTQIYDYTIANIPYLIPNIP